MYFKKRNLCVKTAAWVLTAAMVFSSCPISVHAEDGEETIQEEKATYTKTCPTIGDNGAVTFHYYPEDGKEVSDVYVKGSWDSSWGVPYDLEVGEDGVWSTTVELSLDKSYEYGLMVNDEWYGDPTNTRVGGNSQILRNPYVNSDGSVTIFYYPNGNEEVAVLYKSENTDEYKSIDMSSDEYHPQLLSVTFTEAGSYSYKLKVDGQETDDKNTSNASFSISGEKLEDDENVKSPVIEDNRVTFNYFAPHAEAVKLAGNMTDWAGGAKDLTYDKTTGFWSIDVELEAGNYEYKFIVDGSWCQDPRNESTLNGNSSFLIKGENSVTSPVIKVTDVTFNYYSPESEAVYIAGTMNTWNPTADLMTLDESTGIWSITLDLEPGDYEYKFVADGNWVTDPSNTNYKNGNSAFTVEEVQGYIYTIYYYDENHYSTDSTSLWIWTDGQSGKQYDFDKAVTLEDGKVWLKATVNVDFTKVKIIPKDYSSWTWQDVDKIYNNKNEDKNSTIYLVNGDSKVYTDIQESDKKEKRFAIVEYTRENNDYDGWEIYTWNSGCGSEVVVGFEKINDKMVAMIPVAASKENVSFCMRRSEEGNDWAEKDGGDHDIKLPLDQTIVKATFIQNKGIVGYTEYNIGYETNVEEEKVDFYYRDDQLFKEYKESDLIDQVELIFDGEKLKMDYDSDNERFYLTKDLSAGEHYYGYIVNGELVLDKFNTDTTEVEGTTYSSFKYEKYEANVVASVSKEKINYNENAVLSIEIEDSKDIKIVDITADLSSLGQSKNFKIDPELMAGTIAVKEDTTLGEKIIPVTLKDSYGNKYDTSVTVEVVSREKGDDFDWDEAVIYFAVTDRFFDGDSENNDPYNTGSYDLSQGSLFHGGDFAGLNEKLDYLKELGVNTIWITPIVENTHSVSVASSQYSDQKTAAYHGYWAQDFTKLDAHLGTEEEFSALLAAAHAKGMKIMVDVVLNHAGYGTEDNFGEMLRNEDNTVSGDDKKDGLAGLPDFATENSEVRDLLVEWQSNWISKYDIDYYRVDTVKHVDDTTWKAFKNALTIINPEFKMIGEYAGAGYKTSFGQLGTGQMDALLDFDFNDKALDFVTGKISEVESFLEDRNGSIDNTAMMGSFLGSHDEDGFKYRLIKERKVSDNEAEALSKVAAALQITAKGQPIIYYGEEIGQTGANNWPYQENRYDFDWSKADESNDVLLHYEKLLEIRNANTEVFAKGTRATVAIDEINKVLVVERSYKESEVFVGLNTKVDDTANISVSGLKANTNYTDLYNEVTYTSDEDGIVTLTIPAAKDGGVAILKEKAVKEEKNESTSSDSNTASSSENSSSSDSSVSASVTEAIIVEPTYKRADGITVKGWGNVVKSALQDTITNMLSIVNPNTFVAGYQIPVVSITVDKNATKRIPASVIKEMAETGATYKLVLQQNVIITLDAEALSKMSGALELESFIYNTEKFGQGFKALVVSPYIAAKADENISLTVNLGKENAGKAVYAFTRNPSEFTYVRKVCGIISKDGTFEIEGVDFVNFAILY